MNRGILFAGAVSMIALGFIGMTMDYGMNAQSSIGLGLMWIGLAAK